MRERTVDWRVSDQCAVTPAQDGQLLAPFHRIHERNQTSAAGLSSAPPLGDRPTTSLSWRRDILGHLLLAALFQAPVQHHRRPREVTQARAWQVACERGWRGPREKLGCAFLRASLITIVASAVCGIGHLSAMVWCTLVTGLPASTPARVSAATSSLTGVQDLAHHESEQLPQDHVHVVLTLKRLDGHAAGVPRRV